MSESSNAASLLSIPETLPREEENRYCNRQSGAQGDRDVRRRSFAASSRTVRLGLGSESLLEQTSPPDVDLYRRLFHGYDGDAWLPGFWSQFPYSGAFALLGCLACIATSFAVLVKSNGQPTSAWTLSPAVYIALATTGTNGRQPNHDSTYDICIQRI
jgi:hypothetical protein